MPSRRVRVSSDTFVVASRPKARRGGHEQLRLRADEQEALLWARIPWDRDETVSVTSHIVRLVCIGGSVGTADLTVQGLSRRFTDSEVTWDDKPGTTGPTATLTVTDLADGEVVEIDATAIGQDVAGGAKNRGLLLTTTSATTIRFGSSDAPDEPSIVSTWTEEPAPPSLVPSTGFVSQSHPSIGYEVEGSEADLSAVRLQVDAAMDGTAPDFDSGPVTTSEAMLDLADTAFAGLADGAATFMRGTVTVGGVESAFGEWVPLSRKADGTLAVGSPGGAPAVVTSVTPVILATFTGNAEDLTEHRVRIWDSARESLLFNNRRQPAADPAVVACDVPFRWRGNRVLRRQDESYWVQVQAWGDPDRVDAPGDPAHLEEWVEFTVTEGVLAAPTGFAATPETNGRPGITLTFDIGPDAPDAIAIRVDGEVVEVLDPEDAYVGGTSYSYTFTGVKPYRDASLQVGVIRDGDSSPWTSVMVAQSQPSRVWVTDDARGLRFCLFDVDPEQWEFTDQGALYDPVGSPYRVKITTAQQGMAGEIVGTLRELPDLSLEQQLDDLWAMKARPNRTVQLVTGRWSTPIRMDHLGAGPSAQHRPALGRSLVRFTFRQVGELPFRSRV